MKTTKMTDAQIDRIVSEAWDDAYAHIDRSDYHAAFGVAHRLRTIGLESVADDLSDSIFCRQHDC